MASLRLFGLSGSASLPCSEGSGCRGTRPQRGWGCRSWRAGRCEPTSHPAAGSVFYFYYFFRLAVRVFSIIFFFRILIKKLVLIPAERESVWDSRRREGHAETGGRGVGSERCLLLSPSLSQPQVRSTGRAQPLPALSPFLPSPPPTHTLVVFKF